MASTSATSPLWQALWRCVRPAVSRFGLWELLIGEPGVRTDWGLRGRAAEEGEFSRDEEDDMLPRFVNTGAGLRCFNVLCPA